VATKATANIQVTEQKQSLKITQSSTISLLLLGLQPKAQSPALQHNKTNLLVQIEVKILNTYIT
jgi:hypothetical protein